MSTQELLDLILANTYTHSQASKRLRLLKEIAVNRLFAEPKKEGSTADVVMDEQQTWLQSLDTNIYRHFTQENVYKTFDDLEKAVKQINPLVIYVPIEIPDKELTKLGEKLRQDYGKNFLMEVRIDPTLIAGPSLVWNGIYKDYSLRQKINDSRQTILSTLQEYMKHG